VNRLQGTECAIGAVSSRVAAWEAQLAERQPKLPNADLASLSKGAGTALEEIGRDVGEVSARLRWLVEQVNGNLGRPTTAQIEYIGIIGIYDRRVRDTQPKLDALWKGDLAKLNAGLPAAGLAPLQPD